jgi:hypothetical protein
MKPPSGWHLSARRTNSHGSAYDLKSWHSTLAQSVPLGASVVFGLAVVVLAAVLVELSNW